MNKSTSNGNSGRGHGSSSRHADRTLTQAVQDQPIVSLTIAAVAGFVLGGGPRSAGGLSILALLGQLAMREACGELVSGSWGNGHDA